MAFQKTRKGEEAPVHFKSDDTMGEYYTHPAFAQIGVSRVSGHTSLYDSDFDHNAFMVVRISRSQLNRSVGRDWHFAREEIIEVALSESQWATFVSSPNVGSGVPCTIQHVEGRRAPGIALPERIPQFAGEMRETMQSSLEHMSKLEEAITAAGLSGKKADTLLGHLRMARMQLESNVPFAEEQFSEHMEKTVEKAKAEIHGYINGSIQRAGLAALQTSEMPLQLGASPSKPQKDRADE